MIEIGAIRPSQLVTTFGPGALVNLERDTVMILGLQFWPRDTEEKKYYKRIQHPYLARQLQKSHFKMPITEDKTSAIPCISFPQWGICQECNRLQRHGRISGTEGFNCKACNSKRQLYHAPFIQICDKGHIQDFPWEQWAHLEGFGAGRKQCTKDEGAEPKLEFVRLNKGTSLSNYMIKCLYCGARKTMTGATERRRFSQFGFSTCFGNQPWLGGNDAKPCGEEAYVIQVNSSAVYYPSTVTSLLIPKWIHDVDELLDENDGENAIVIRKSREGGKSYEKIIDFFSDDMFKEILQSYTKEEVIIRLMIRFDSADETVSTEGEALEQEFDDFADVNKRTVRGPAHDRKIDIEVMDLSENLKDFQIGKMMKFHRLVAIQVLRGFTRGVPPDPYATEEQISKKNPFRQISSGSQRDKSTGELNRIDWLPAVETKGEGLFFSFDETKLQNWEKRENVRQRVESIVSSYAKNIDAQNRSELKNILERFNLPRYILLHTFAHLLIREIADYAGYHEASIKERIYATSDGKQRNGIMIYTSSSSSDGSLGGIVKLGDTDRFEKIIENTIKRSNMCSRDPLCGETDPIISQEQGTASGTQLTGASCYSCTLLPETSCQNFNNILDRWMLSDPKDGFFRDDLDDL